MKSGLGGLMKQAQAMQENLQKVQEELANTEVTGESGAGMVKIVMTGRNDVRKVSIDPAVMDDREMLEDLVAAAVNDAAHKLEQARNEKMSGVTSGLNLPPGMKLPFS